ncbi:hypothetical protein [Hyalangium rubrum]|uniref:Lipoprotein MlpA n=1 Tax=Hyalangium rubrum TaxID=3103134 RepID=A0ABU5H8N7_9BACT|nr:hypothetical protein [Hyalangium sp. s54d21]MDY7229229.1 hypothetical protein [Hyalangium sp. s54d21]
MTKNIVSVAAALLGAGALLSSCNFEQPEAGCIVQDASLNNWYAKYDVEGDAPSAECDRFIPKGETLGVFKFTNPEEGREGETKLTIRPSGLASRGARDPGDPYLQTAVGAMVDEPDAGNFCGASDFSAATVNASARAANPDTGVTAEDATVITYQFEDVNVYSSPSAPGTQLKGTLAYTRVVQREGGPLTCTARLKVRALWPVAACDPASNEPRNSCGAGSGVNPDFDAVCDPVLKFCVPAGEIPSFRAQD